MKKILLYIAILTATLSASTCTISPSTPDNGTAFVKTEKLNFLEPYIAITESKKTNKPIIAIIASSNCPAWKILQTKLNTNKELKNLISKNFILTGINGYEMESFPHLTTDISPTIFLLNSDFVQVADSVKGVPVSDKEFIKWLRDFNSWYEKTIND